MDDSSTENSSLDENIEIGETDQSGSENSSETGESESESEEDVGNQVKVQPKFKRIRKIVSSDDDSEGIEEKAFSTRTRLSMTGNYPENYSDESDNDSLILDQASEDEGTAEIDSSEAHQISQTSIHDEEFIKLKKMQADLESIKKLLMLTSNALPDEGIALQNKYQKLLVQIELQQQVVRGEKSTLNDDMSKDQEENSFEASSEDVLASTFLDSSSIGNQIITLETLSPIVDLTQRRSVNKMNTHSISDVIDILSSDDEEVDERPIAKKPIDNESLELKPIRKTVSQSYYEFEVNAYNDLVNGLKSSEKLLLTAVNLPDGGAKLKIRIEKTKREIEEKKRKIAALEVDDQESARSKILKDFNDNSNNMSNKSDSVQEISWEELKSAADIKPKYVGSQGMQTFNTQKALTVENLKMIHDSLETCPSPDVLKEQPKAIKIELMNHQKHALAWMIWREKQKPSSGLLGDDMGLGKTLSMIALIITQKEKEEDDDSDGENNDENSNDWRQKGRKDLQNGGTLIICPASLLKQWESEINSRVKKNTLNVALHHGSNREYKAKRLARYDVVITTYSVAMHENKNNSVLYQIKWNRIIIDEAHVIRNHKSQTSIAICALEGRYRWALSGTPIQNREFDLFAVLKFLNCKPFDDIYYWKTWIEGKGAGGSTRLQTLMKAILLRRTKKQLLESGDLKDLPSKEMNLVEVTLSKNEMNVYQKVLLYSQTMFVQFMSQRTESNSNIENNKHYYKLHERFKQMHGNTAVKSHQILVLLLRLRQICCHPVLIHAILEESGENMSFDGEQNASVNELDLLAQLQKMKIDHVDSDVVSQASDKVLLTSNPIFDKEFPSTKINKLLEILESKILPLKEKAVVVSQFKSYLDIVKEFLKERGISSCDFNGSVPVKDRNDIVVSFNRENEGPKVMLLSLTSGGVGLNLVGANHLFLMDLHWNPQLETQAQDRIYRFGQKREVHIYKFFCKDTIEVKILGLQDKKLQIANSVLTGTKQSATKLTIDDLKSLFGI